MHAIDQHETPAQGIRRHPPVHRARRFGSATIDRRGVILECDEIWQRELGAPAGSRIDAVVCAADAPHLISLLARTDDGLSVAVRTGHRDSDVSLILHLEGAFRNGAWQVIGMPTFLPRHTDRAGEPVVTRDVLTGLLDRAAYESELADTLARCRQGDSAALLLIDLDGFKRFNDTYGHALGDQLLRAVGARIGDALRDGDCGARFGGDEFAVIVHRVSPLDARIAAERVLSAVRLARATDLGMLAGVHASIGLALLGPGDELDADEAMTRADLALYQAKSAGPGVVVEYPSGDPDAAVRMRVRMSWGQRLHRAIERDRLELHAQPIVDLRSGALAGCELVLHLHDGDEVLHADAFRDHVVRAGLADRVDEWLLHRVVEVAADPALPLRGIPLGIGVTAKVLEDRTLPARLHSELEQVGVDPGTIVLQLRDIGSGATERSLDTAIGLRRFGIRIALDGFGGRACALTALRDLPFTELRLDPELTSAAAAGVFGDSVIAYAITLGEEFGLDIVATGIESPADAERARAFGIVLGQGGLFGGPQPLHGELVFPPPAPLL